MFAQTYHIGSSVQGHGQGQVNEADFWKMLFEWILQQRDNGLSNGLISNKEAFLGPGGFLSSAQTWYSDNSHNRLEFHGEHSGYRQK